MAGWNGSDLAKSAEATATFDWAAPTIRAFAQGGRGPAKIESISGKLEWKDGVLTFNESRMTTSNGIYSITGTVEAEKLAVQCSSESAAGYRLTGTLRAPDVAVTEIGAAEKKTSKTQASLQR